MSQALGHWESRNWPDSVPALRKSEPRRENRQTDDYMQVISILSGYLLEGVTPTQRRGPNQSRRKQCPTTTLGLRARGDGSLGLRDGLHVEDRRTKCRVSSELILWKINLIWHQMKTRKTRVSWMSLDSSLKVTELESGWFGPSWEWERYRATIRPKGRSPGKTWSWSSTTTWLYSSRRESSLSFTDWVPSCTGDHSSASSWD